MKIEIVRGKNFSSNSFILAEESVNKIVIVDLGIPGRLSGFPLKTQLNKITNNNFEVEIEVFLTHCHADHILGSDNLTDYNKVKFSASPLTAKHINNNEIITLISSLGLNEEINYKVTKEYQDKEFITLEGAKLEVIHAPGHTDGSAVIYDHKSKSLFAGDVVFAEGGCGRTDLPTGKRRALVTTLEKLAELEIEHLYSGHGAEVHKDVKENILSAKRMLEM